MRASTTILLVLLGLVLISARSASARTPFIGGLLPDYSEDMEHDSDTYTPTDNDPLNDPFAAGNPPGAYVGDGSYGDNGDPGTAVDPGPDGEDARTIGAGFIEEVPSGFLGVFTPDGSGHFAIVQMEGPTTDAPYDRTNQYNIGNPVPGGTGNRTGYWASIDVWVDPTRPYNGPDGIPDVWISNSVNDNTANYMSESGMTLNVDPSGLTWEVSTTAGQFLGTVPVGTWIGLEVEPKIRISDGGVDFEHRLYSDGGSHAVLLASFTAPAAFTGAGAFANLYGPRAQWEGFNLANMPYLYVDNIGWRGYVPEPSSIALLGMGMVGLIVAARRRRKA